MVVCEMTGAQADNNIKKPAMGTIFLIIIYLPFQIGALSRPGQRDFPLF
jgi:hypothetical protein